MELLDKNISFLSGGDDGNSNKENAKTAAVPNEEEAYGQFITNTLNRFSPYQRMFVKKRIGDVLFEIEYASFTPQSSP